MSRVFEPGQRIYIAYEVVNMIEEAQGEFPPFVTVRPLVNPTEKVTIDSMFFLTAEEVAAPIIAAAGLQGVPFAENIQEIKITYK